jgi:integrase
MAGKRIDAREAWVSVAPGLRRRGRTDRYQLRVSTGQVQSNGAYRTVERNVTAPSVKAAKLQLSNLRLEVASGKHSTPEPRTTGDTFGDFLTEWLDWYCDPARHAETTSAVARVNVEHSIRPHLGGVRLVDIDARKLDAFYTAMLATGKASSTVAKLHTLCYGALGQAVKWGRIPFNPAANASPPPATNKTMTPPDVQDAVKLLEAAFKRDLAFGTLLHVAMCSGCCRGEACALRWSDIDLERGTVTIRRSAYRVAGRTGVRETTKTGKVRKVSIDAETVRVLRRYRASCEAAARRARCTLSDRSYLFSTRPDFAEPVSPAAMSARFIALRDKLGLSGFTWKDATRHLHATQLAPLVDIKTLSGRLGHANAAMTLNVYSAWLPARDSEAADAFAGLLGGAA